MSALAVWATSGSLLCARMKLVLNKSSVCEIDEACLLFLLSRCHPLLALPSSSPLWPSHHLHRDRQHRAVKPSSSHSTDLESSTHHPE